MRILARTPALKISRQITSRALFTFTPPRPPPAAMPGSEPLLNHSGSKADYPSGGGSGDVPRPPRVGPVVEGGGRAAAGARVQRAGGGGAQPSAGVPGQLLGPHAHHDLAGHHHRGHPQVQLGHGQDGDRLGRLHRAVRAADVQRARVLARALQGRRRRAGERDTTMLLLLVVVVVV